MKIKINKKMISLILAGTMGFSLSSCAKNDDVTVDTFTLNEVSDEVEDKTITDEVLENSTIDLVNPFNYEYVDTVNLIEATNKLEDLLAIGQKLSMMRELPVLDKEDENYFMVESTSEWTEEDINELVDTYINSKGEESVEAAENLTYYKTYLDQELRVNGINIATALLDLSIKSKVLDVYDGNLDEIGMVSVYGNTVFYGGKKLLFNNKYELSLLDNLYNIIYNREDFDELVSFEGVNSVLNETLDVTKNVIYNDFVEEKNKVKSI